MPKDAFTAHDQCTYCGRPAAKRWDGGLRSCRHEVCQGLAHAAALRRQRDRPQRRK
jgi:ribosomal protein L37AE/L43A